MLSLLRQKAASQLRGGHGWPRPDVPLLVPYVNRRKVDIMDTNMWIYCNVMPEYFISQQEAYLKNPVGALKQMAIDGRYILYTVLGVIFMNEFILEGRRYGVMPDHFQHMIHTYPKKVQLERPHLKKHFLDLSVSADMGMVFVNVGAKTFIQEYSEAHDAQRKMINVINEEGKTYLQRVRNEAEQAVNKKHGVGHSEHSEHSGHSSH